MDGCLCNSSQATFVGENFVRATGETVSMNKMQVFAWQAYEKGQDVNLQARWPPNLCTARHKRNTYSR